MYFVKPVIFFMKPSLFYMCMAKSYIDKPLISQIFTNEFVDYKTKIHSKIVYIL